VLVLAAIAFYGEHIFTDLHRLWLNNSIAIVLSGLLIAVFLVNHAIAVVASPFFKKMDASVEERDRLRPGSEYVGWIERALVFVFVFGGHPEAALLAITAKSLARLPYAEERPGFAEYFIVGTLTSVLAATLVAALARIALGQPAL
jgi:hypothetical protein